MVRAALLLALAALAALPAAAAGPHFSRVADAYAATSVNTAVFRQSSVTSLDSIQYVAFYDPDGRVTVGRRLLGTDSWDVRPTQYTGNVRDAHNVISITVDGDGYLHLAFDHHGHPLHYARSLAPDTLAFGPLEPMTGTAEHDVTYPEFHTLPCGDLLFVYRSGASGNGSMVMNRYNRAARRWTRLHDVLIDGEGQRNAYWQMCTDPAGTIHLSWVWRETWLVETNHDLCYACSRDGGLTWQRSDGTPYTLPITASTAEVAVHIPQGSELINQTSMSADADGRPLIATYWRQAADSVPQFRLVSLGADGWQVSTVGRRRTPFSLSGGGTKMIPVSRPQVVSDSRGTIHYIFRDAERGSRVSVATRTPTDPDWHIRDLTDFSVGAWEPTLDRNLWHTRHLLHLYVQPTAQGDGETVTDAPPSPACILELP